MLKLRPYQEEAVSRALAAWNEGKNALLSLATGTGKTVVFSDLCRKMADRGLRTCVCMHLHTLVAQTAEKLALAWKGAPGIVCASESKGKDASRPVTIATVQSLQPFVRDHKDLSFDCLIVDEGHHIPPKDTPSRYRSLLETLFARNPSMRLLAVTATPFRMGQGMLAGDDSSWFPEVTYSYTVDQGQREGYLCRYQHLVPVDIRGELAQMPLQNGEYKRVSVSELMRRRRHLNDVVTYIKKLASDRRHICVYAVDIDHAEAVTLACRAAGFAAACVHSKNAANAAAFEDFRNGRARILVSVDMLAEGYDFPPTDCLVICSPTKSLSRHLQIIGRGLRPAPGKKDCLILDLACNAMEHGSARNPVVPKRGGEPAPRLVACPKCATLNGVVPGKTQTYRCTSCGADLREAACIIEVPKGRVAVGRNQGKEAEEMPLFPYMERNVLENLVRSGAKAKVVKVVYETAQGAGGKTIRLKVVCLHEGAIVACVMPFYFSPRGNAIFRQAWETWGSGREPADADAFESAIKNGTFSVPEYVGIVMGKWNRPQVRLGIADGQGRIEQPAVMPRFFRQRLAG